MLFRVPYSGIKNYCISFMCSVQEPAHEILILIVLSSNTGTSGSAQMCRLIRAFIAGIHKV